MIELTDSNDSTHHPRPSQPSASSGPRQNALANMEDPIIITSGSEDGQSQAIRPTQRRISGPGGTQGRGANRTRASPPSDADVILISDSEEEVDARGVMGGRASTSGVNRVAPPVRPFQGVSAATLSAPKPATAPAPATTTAPTPAPIPASATPSTSTQLPQPPSAIPQATQQKDAELPPQPSPAPSYGPPPDFDDPFNDIDFDATGDDANPGGALEGWDDLDIGPSLATLPVAISSGAANAGASANTNVPEGGEDASGPDALFDSYVNMDQLGGDTNQGTDEGAVPGGGGDGVEGSTVGSGATNGPGVSMREGDGSSTSGGGDRVNVGGDGDVRMQDLEEGEVEPNDVPVRSARRSDTPESGEIRSQESRLGSGPGENARTAEGESPSSGSVAQPHVSFSSSSVVAKLGPAFTVPHVTPSTLLSPSSDTSSTESTRSAVSLLLPRTSTLVMPDISSYKGVRFKRPFPEARESSFFSRALGGASWSSGKAPVREESTSGGIPVQGPSSVGEVRSRDPGDADMQGDAATSIPEAVVPTPSSLPQPQVEVPPVTPVTQSTLSTTQVRLSTVELSTAETDGLSASTSTQPTPSSSQTGTPSRPPSATQPLAGSSNRPFTVPPRVPRPGTPMSLVDALNEVRRVRLEALKAQRRLAGRQSVADPTGAFVPLERFIVSDICHSAGESATAVAPAPSTSPGQGPMEAWPLSQPSTPTPTQTQTPPSSHLKSTRALGRTPSLNDLRTLLAKRNVGAGQPGRPTPASTSTSTFTAAQMQMQTQTHASNVDGDVQVLAEPVAVPAPRSTDGDERVASSEEGASAKRGALVTPTTTTTTTPSASGLGVSLSGGVGASASVRRREVSFVPFEAFISPVQSRSKNVNYDRDHDNREGEKRIEKSGDKGKGKGKGKEVAYSNNAFATPTAARSRASTSMGASAGMSLLGSHRSKGRVSASAAFEAYIMRDSPKRTSRARTGASTDTNTDTDTGAGVGTDDVRVRPDIEPLRQPLQPHREPRFSESASASVASDVGPADDANAMDVDAGDACVASMRVDDGVALAEGEGEGEADEVDPLLELASVHLTPIEAVAADEADKVGENDVTDEVRCACMLCVFLALLRVALFLIS